MRYLMASAAMLLLLTLAAPVPALAQVDFSGEWANRMHEDQPERAGGPMIGDFAGLPINVEEKT